MKPKKWPIAFSAGLFLATVGAQAETTGMTGSGAPFNNLQPSLVVTQAAQTTGIFPSLGGGATGGTLGFIYNFAGNYDPGNSLFAQGQLLSIASNTALFSLYGTTYGGNGETTFALPNLSGRATIGTGAGLGLPSASLGQVSGSTNVTLTTNQFPSHNHALSTAAGGVTGFSGGSQPYSNTQPSIAMTRLIAVDGSDPLGGSGDSAFLGQVATYAGPTSYIPGGWLPAQGQLLSIASNTALFSILGTTYGGDGRTTFALPDLQGRISVGTNSSDPMLRLGNTFGEQSTTLTTAQLAAHLHSAPDVDTGLTGSGATVSNYQSSLALNHVIALEGIYPVHDGGSGFADSTPIIGQIVEFAGNFAPEGWAFANGQLLSIASNQALFSILGTTYGGDGRTTFALPDLRGRTMIGSGGIYDLGEKYGAAFNTLTVDNLPAHSHEFIAAIPEPEIYAMMGLGLGMMGWAARRRKQKQAATQ